MIAWLPALVLLAAFATLAVFFLTEARRVRRQEARQLEHAIRPPVPLDDGLGKAACPLCAEYLELKQRAESSEAAARPLLDANDRTEATYRERLAAALFEQHIRIPWAMAYPDDIQGYLDDADAFLAIRDTELAHAQAAIERVRVLADRWDSALAPARSQYSGPVRAALDYSEAVPAELVHPDTEQQASSPDQVDEHGLASTEQPTTERA